jgi:hypothetical protein
LTSVKRPGSFYLPRDRCNLRNVIGAAVLFIVLTGPARAVVAQGTGVRTDEDKEAAAGSLYQLMPEIPPVIRKGGSVTLVLHVRRDGRPVDKVTACLEAVPLFPSIEDTTDTTPSGGIDLGTDPDSASQPGCVHSIAGVMTGPGVCEFTWEPDTTGRVNLTFTVGTSVITVPVDVASAPPNAAVITFFVIFVGAVLSTAGFRRRRLRPRGSGS